jgi:hypothetical protein
LPERHPPNDWLRKHAAVSQRGDRVLCVADGEGRNSVWLAERRVKVDAFDIAEIGVAKARRLTAAQGVAVNFAVTHCDAYPWPRAAYDGVAAIFVQFAGPGMRERLFANMVKSVKLGGTLVLQGYTPKQLEYRTGGPPLASHLYTEASLRATMLHCRKFRLHQGKPDLHFFMLQRSKCPSHFKPKEPCMMNINQSPMPPRLLLKPPFGLTGQAVQVVEELA